MSRRLAILTTGRADWNILSPVARAAHADAGFDVTVLGAAAHLDAEQGMTIRDVEQDGLPPVERVPWGRGSPARRAARLTAGVDMALERLCPDMLLVLGDRFEVLSAAVAAVLRSTPIAHLGGGEVSQGAMDDAFRHALSRLAHLHLVSHAPAATALLEMGEPADRIHLVGNPALDDLVEKARSISDEELQSRLKAPLGDRNLLVTFHPVTLSEDRGLAELRAVLEAVDRLGPEWTVWVTAPNADPGGDEFMATLAAWTGTRPHIRFRKALGNLYPALTARCLAVLGNSSSGLAEVATLGVPAVDVGMRQAGRLAGTGVVHAPAQPQAILAALRQAVALPRSALVNPYGDGRSVPRILECLRGAPPRHDLLRKRFNLARS